jgi:hypothetical protein
MLVDNIAVDETGDIDIEELTSKLKNDNKDLDSQIIGKFLRRLFHNVSRKLERSKNDWTERKCLYQGVKWKPTDDENKTCSFQDMNTHYIHSVVVQDFVSGRVCCVNQYHYESRQRRVVMRSVHATDKT